MAKQTAKPGTCYNCNDPVTKRTAVSHLLKKHSTDSGDTYLMLMVDTPYASPYWMVLLVKSDAMLSDLDESLRDIWVECCGHLSAFNIQGMEFERRYDGDIDSGFEESESMEIEISEVLCTGMVFRYEYDFGSTTELRLKVMDTINWEDGPRKIIMAAMNDMPEAFCTECGKPAVYHNLDSDDGQVLCKDCASDDTIDEDYLLPICNSPRTGVCGYEGGRYDEEIIDDVE